MSKQNIIRILIVIGVIILLTSFSFIIASPHIKSEKNISAVDSFYIKQDILSKITKQQNFKLDSLINILKDEEN